MVVAEVKIVAIIITILQNIVAALIIHLVHNQGNVMSAQGMGNVQERDLHQNTIVTDLVNVMLVMAKAIME